MIKIRAKACIKCREFITIHPDSLGYQKIERAFEKKHLGHTVVIVNLDEIKGFYTRSE